MKVRDLLEALEGVDPDMEVYYSTGSMIDNLWGTEHSVSDAGVEYEGRFAPLRAPRFVVGN